MKKIKRKEESNGVIGKAVPVDKSKLDLMNAQEAEEDQDQDEDSPLLNFSCNSKDPPRTTYQDYGDSVQSKILGK